MSISLVGVVALALLHMFAGRLHGGATVRPWWLSAASGVSVAYVFIHLLPELSEGQSKWLEARPDRHLQWLDRQVYLTALLGLLLALGLDRASAARGGTRGRFWLHTGSFALYNLLIGAMALRLTRPAPVALAAFAFGAHFLVNDHSLHRQHGRAYESAGRWVLASAILIGWLLAAAWRPPVLVGVALLGLLSGGIILNALKEEIPEGRLSAFVAGTLAYSAVLLALAFSVRAD